MRRRYVCAVILTLTVSATAQARSKKKFEGRPPAGVPISYSAKHSGGYNNFLLVLRNEKKIRPLFLSGKGQKSRFTVEIKQLGAVSVFAESKDMADLLDAFNSTGSLEAHAYYWSGSRFGLEHWTGADWMDRKKWPVIVFHINAISDWKPVEDKRGKVDRDAFEVLMDAELRADKQVARIKERVMLRFKSGGGMSLNGKFTFQGADVGLTGKDAGTISARFSLGAHTTFAGAADKVLKKQVDEGITDELMDF